MVKDALFHNAGPGQGRGSTHISSSNLKIGSKLQKKIKVLKLAEMVENFLYFRTL